MLPTKSKFHRGTGWLANGNEGPRLARTQGENLLFFRRLARPEGFEPPTPTFVEIVHTRPHVAHRPFSM
jgi:hypothetical protein